MNAHSGLDEGIEAGLSHGNDLTALDEAVAELSQRVLSGVDFDQLLQEATDHLVRVLEVELGGVFEFQEEPRSLCLRAGRGWSNDLYPPVTVSLEAGWEAGFQFSQGDSATSVRFSADDRHGGPRFLADHGVVGGIAAKIEGKGRTYGLLGAFTTRERTFDRHELDFLKAVAHVVSEAVSFSHEPRNRTTRSAMLRATAHQMPALVWSTDSGLRIGHALGARLPAFADYTRFLGKTLYEFFDTHHPSFPPIAAHRAALDGRVASFLYRLQGLLLDVCVEPLRDGERGIVGCVATAIDISNLDRTEKELRLLSTAVESAANAIIIADHKGEITWVNAAFQQLTGYSLEEVQGQPFLKSCTDEDQEIWEIIRSGRVWHGERVHRRKDGSRYTALQTITPASDSDRRISHFISIRQDITERKELEEQFRQAQKMEAIGKLAGGVAHDFNNLLTAIVGYSDLVLAAMHGDDPRRPDLLAIKNAADRASSLTRQLLAFSRRQVLQPSVLDLNQTVTHLGKMLRRLIGEDVDLVTVLDQSLGRTEADPGQVEQVILNLALNARDAMPEGGTLTIETQNVELGETYFQRQPVVQPGPYVMLSMSDTGPGIDKEILPHIFEPFFTTKEAGKGSGLGLSTVYGIVKQSGGYIFAYSEPGMGTTFKVYLPRLDDRIESDRCKQESLNVTGSETILLVEDEPEVRRLTRRILEQNGYRVMEACNGADALLLSQEHEGPIHLLLTDVVMPVMGGSELAKRQCLVRPDMKILFMSGYTDEAIARHGVLEPDTNFIEKPFPATTLLAKVREALDRADGKAPTGDRHSPSEEED